MTNLNFKDNLEEKKKKKKQENKKKNIIKTKIEDE